MKFVQNLFPPSAAVKSIPKKFRMQEIAKYNETINPNEHVTSYTHTIKRNDLEDDEMECVLLKMFGENLSKGARYGTTIIRQITLIPFPCL